MRTAALLGVGGAIVSKRLGWYTCYLTWPWPQARVKLEVYASDDEDAKDVAHAWATQTIDPNGDADVTIAARP